MRTASKMILNEGVTGASPRASGPDFLCIGQPKAGTGWLYDVLQFEPDFWMPPIKELMFFNNHFPGKRIGNRYARDMERRIEKLNKKRKRQRRRVLDGRDIEFAEYACTYNKKDKSIDWYKELFVPKGNLLSGDITPAYSGLDGEVLASISRALPDLRIVLLLRDPVSRVWSHFNMRQRREMMGRCRGVKKPSADVLAAFQQTTSAEAVVQYLRIARVRRVSFATVIYENWSRHFDPSQISVVFFEDIVESPETVMKKFREDLGLSGSVPGSDRARVDFNRKADLLKADMGDEMRAVLVNTFRDEMLRCAELFGGAAEHWPRRYGIA